MLKRLHVQNLDTGMTLVEAGRVADTFMQRLIGLLGSAPLAAGEGIWLVPCNSIHMFFLNFAIDAVFLDAQQQVVHLIEGLKPWRMSPIVRKSRSVLELPIGAIARNGTRIGHRLQMTEVEQ
jgi:uncharacterized membrane protein (UPF0127 family)